MTGVIEIRSHAIVTPMLRRSLPDHEDLAWHLPQQVGSRTKKSEIEVPAVWPTVGSS